VKRLAAFAAALLLAGCATGPAPAPQPRPSRPAPVQPLPGTVSPATYVAQAASIDLFVIRSSELALVRSPSAAVRTFASRMIEAHQGTSAQLAFAGRRLDLLPPAAMLPQQQAMYDELESSGDFDRTYLRLQSAVHGAALSLHANFARLGASPTLRPVAANAEAVERNHLDMLRRF
jgi:predicted outer membrane protein